jgi:hypothetical protein
MEQRKTAAIPAAVFLFVKRKIYAPHLAHRLTNCASVRLRMLQNGTPGTVYDSFNPDGKIIQLFVFTTFSKKNIPYARIAQKLATPLQ